MTEPFLFTAGTNIYEAMDQDDRVIRALQGLGLKCFLKDEPCVAAAVETLADAARYHDIPLDRILQTLNGLGIQKKPAEAPPPEKAP